MEPLRRNQFDLNQRDQAVEANAGVAKHPDVSHMAGHILLHETPHGGEISLDESGQMLAKPPSQESRVDHSAWHAIKLNKIDEVIEQDYGQAFEQERRPEQTMAGARASNDGTAQPVAGQSPSTNPITMTSSVAPEPAKPYAAPVIPVPNISTPLSASNPIYNTMSHPISSQQPQPVNTQQSSQQYTSIAKAEPAHQQLSQSPLGSQLGYTDSSSLTGAVSPFSSQPSLPLPPEASEPRLESGKSLRVDPQHLLPAAKRHISNYAKNPWVWLAIGILMILYFARSL